MNKVCHKTIFKIITMFSLVLIYETNQDHVSLFESLSERMTAV